MGNSPKKIVPRMEIYEDGGPWMWVAFAPSCRLIVDFIIDPRKQYVADKLLESVSKRLKSIPLFVTISNYYNNTYGGNYRNYKPLSSIVML